MLAKFWTVILCYIGYEINAWARWHAWASHWLMLIWRWRG